LTFTYVRNVKMKSPRGQRPRGSVNSFVPLILDESLILAQGECWRRG
jgi:hypothetical protein